MADFSRPGNRQSLRNKVLQQFPGISSVLFQYRKGSENDAPHPIKRTELLKPGKIGSDLRFLSASGFQKEQFVLKIREIRRSCQLQKAPDIAAQKGSL